MKKIIIGLFLISVSSLTNAEVFQCKVDGRMVFQDKPCTGSNEQKKRILNKQNEYKSAITKRERDQAEFNSRTEPKLGMNMSQAEKSTWGYPDKVNKTTDSSGVSEQWVYRWTQGNKYLYFKNGVLTSIQD